MSAEKNKTSTRRFTDECWNKKDLSVIDELVARGCPHHMNGPVNFKGRNGFKGALEAWFKAFPDLQVTTEDEVAEGDKVAVRCKLKGTHDGELYFPGIMPSAIAPTGKQVEMEAVFISRFAEAKFAETWSVIDYSWIQKLSQIH